MLSSNVFISLNYPHLELYFMSILPKLLLFSLLYYFTLHLETKKVWENYIVWHPNSLKIWSQYTSSILICLHKFSVSAPLFYFFSHWLDYLSHSLLFFLFMEALVIISFILIVLFIQLLLHLATTTIINFK